MNKLTIADQAECQSIFAQLNCAEVFKPIPPNPVCDGILQLDQDAWLCGTNTNGFITLHLLMACTKDEAWQFFENMRGPNTVHINPRMTFVGPANTAVTN